MDPTGELGEHGGWVLVISTALGVARREVAPGARLILGRGPSADIEIDDDSVSRRHAQLVVGALGEASLLEDLGSRHGTTVLDTPLATGISARWPAGATAALGRALIVLHRGAPAEAAPAEAAPIEAAPAEAAPIDALVVDPAMREAYALLETVAPSSLSVLILGETGTGKEVYARALHARSARADQPFVALNCASLVDSLLESELFGHEKGAYTGATAAKPGLLEIADGGTVFLDEIGELPAAAQAKLLRVLESGELLRVGGVAPRRIDIRLLAATNVDLDAAIAAGRFRRDLYYRLDGVVVTLPPLRERRGELLPLARRFAAALGRSRFTDAAEQALLAHAWPGNVRELKTVTERAVLLSAQRGTIDVGDLRLTPRRPAPTSPAPTNPAAPDEREQILEALQRSHGNQKDAARLLGYSRQTLAKKLDAHGIGRPRKG